METHLKVLAILYLVFAGLSVLFGLGILLLTGVVSGIVGTSGDTGFAIPFIRLGGTAAAVFCFAWAVPGFVVGFGLLGRQPWARILGIVLSALSLMHVPLAPRSASMASGSSSTATPNASSPPACRHRPRAATCGASQNTRVSLRRLPGTSSGPTERPAQRVRLSR